MKQFDPNRARETARRLREGIKPVPLFTPSKPVAGENVWL